MLFFVGACRDLVQDEFPDFIETPTVNSILINDSIIKVHVSLARGIDTNLLEIVENAEIKLFKNNDYVETLDYAGNGFYLSGTTAEPNNKYYCEVSIPQYQNVFCYDSLPEPKKMIQITHINHAEKNEEGLIYPALKFSFSNNPDERRYYEVVIRFFEYETERIASLEEITDPVILSEGLPLALFSNEFIRDSIYEMTLNYTTNSSDQEGMNLYPLILEFRSVSYNYYRYVKQLFLYEKGRYPGNITSSSTVFSLYSNIIGGYGIFAGYSASQSDTILPN